MKANFLINRVEGHRDYEVYLLGIFYMGLLANNNWIQVNVNDILLDSPAERANT